MIKLDMSYEEYAADPGIGSGTAKTFLTSSQLTKDALDGILNKEDRPSYQVGRLAHMMLLEPARFKRQIVTEGPINPKTGAMYGRNTLAFGAWQEQNPDLTVVEPFLYMMLDRMPPNVRVIFADKQANAEVSIFQTLAGVRVKARLDWHRGQIITDLKTIDNVDDIDGSIRRFRYWFQAGWYRMVARAEFVQCPGWRFVFAEKRPPFRWRIVELDADYLMYADQVADDTLNGIALAQKSGDWTDKEEVLVTASRPVWSLPDTETDE